MIALLTLWLLSLQMLYLVSAVEWIAFVCNYSFGAKWRESLIERPKAPTIVTYILANSKVLDIQLCLVSENYVYVIKTYEKYIKDCKREKKI